jgi:transposase InsO family protein
VGSVGDSYANALAETINSLYKTELIHRQPWKSQEAVELATLAWVDWFNHRRLLAPIAMYHRPRPKQRMIATQRVRQSGVAHANEPPE